VGRDAGRVGGQVGLLAVGGLLERGPQGGALRLDEAQGEGPREA
jgi:hypothetical protein